MTIDVSQFCLREGQAARLGTRPTRTKPFYRSKEHYKEILSEHLKQLGSLQDRLYAERRSALLVILQGMDAAGKDGAIKHVMSGVNPEGCQVYSFKQPSAQELEHDFLWRTTRCLPERGRIGIFNRSYYEEVLVVRVHPELLLSQGLPSADYKSGRLWRERYRSIVEFERHLRCNGTRILKFFLHISKEEQRRRFLERIDDPDRNWKFSQADFNERGRWRDYRRAYEACLTATSTKGSPWYIVPADDKEAARLIVSQAIMNTLDDLNPRYPSVSRRRRRELKAIRRLLEK